ncbi:MAG TPA: transglutaminase-like cysteine peptidase [Methylocella sp.]|nr:transglutaminase-like cysteine peptidase [Methylocella sp.]
MQAWREWVAKWATVTVFLAGFAGAVGSAVLISPAMAGESGTSSVPLSVFAPIGGVASTPYGWLVFCRRYGMECEGEALPPTDIGLTPKAMKEIIRVNQWVNDHVKAVSDMEHWGLIDRWDYPYDGKGDCEDFALFKRRILIDEGFPRQALLMTVVKDEHNEGHAVLTVKTTGGDYILDNMNDEVKPWNKTGYRFVKRQSQADQNIWVQIGDPTSAPAYVSR